MKKFIFPALLVVFAFASLVTISAFFGFTPKKIEIPERATIQFLQSHQSGKDQINKNSFQLSPNKCVTREGEAFDKIYREGTWNHRAKTKPAEDFYGNAAWPPNRMRQQSGSGLGSNLGEATETSLSIVKETIFEHNISSMIDIPCGDANWIFDSFITDTLPVYLGLDIVKDVIEVNKLRFSHHQNKKFQLWDAVTCPLPKYQVRGMSGEQKAFELVHVRDVLQHLPLDQGIKYICNVLNSGARVLITTTYPNMTNKEILSGDWYKNNLEKEPFSFPKSNTCTPTHPGIEDDHTCVYDLTDPWVNDYVSQKC